MEILNRLIDLLRAKPEPVSVPQPTTVQAVQAPAQQSHAVNFDDLLRAMGADI